MPVRSRDAGDEFCDKTTRVVESLDKSFFPDDADDTVPGTVQYFIVRPKSNTLYTEGFVETES